MKGVTRHKCFISYKKEDEDYKKLIGDELGDHLIDNSLLEPINSDDPDYVMRKIREDHLSTESTVTIFLIGKYSAENLGEKEQQYIKRELQASLYNGKGNTRNGILGIVLPEMYGEIYRGTYSCSKCGNNHNHVAINDKTVIREFSTNYYLYKPEGTCGYPDANRYCVLAKWEDFVIKPDFYIQRSYDNRSEDIADRVIVYP